jgi:hypothetical protein
MLYIFLAALLVAAIAWRILNHPLRGFPGPPVAALTGLYAAYWDVVKYGRLLEHVTELHKKYGAFLRHTSRINSEAHCCVATGPVVRIGPNEVFSKLGLIWLCNLRFLKLSFCDPKGFLDVYSSRFAKGTQFYQAFGLNDSVIGAIEFSHWRIARDRLNKFFSRRVTLSLENVVQTIVCLLR